MKHILLMMYGQISSRLYCNRQNAQVYFITEPSQLPRILLRQVVR